jgi:hypothetical protein
MTDHHHGFLVLLWFDFNHPKEITHVKTHL